MSTKIKSQLLDVKDNVISIWKDGKQKLSKLNWEGKVLWLMVIAAAVAVFVFQLTMLCSAFPDLGGRSYKKTVDQFVKAQFEGDSEKIVELLVPNYVPYIINHGKYESYDMIIYTNNYRLREELSTFRKKYGENYKISYKIQRVKDAGGADLAFYQSAYREVADITDAKLVTVKITFKGKGWQDDEGYYTDISLVKVGRSWYLELVDTEGSLFHP